MDKLGTNKERCLVGKDVAEVLGYPRPRNAILTDVDEEDKKQIAYHDLQTLGLNDFGTKGGWLINESGLYSLILRSDMPKVICGGNNMVKAKDIMKIKSYTEDQLLEIEYGLSNIELYLDQSKDIDLHKKVFIDRYIKKIPIGKLVDKYSISRTCLYGIVNRAKKAFEYNKEISIYKYK